MASISAPAERVIERAFGRMREHGARGGVWSELARQVDAPAVGTGDVWRGLERRLTIGPPARRTNLWPALAARVDPAQYRPCAIPDVAEEQVSEQDQTFTVICSPRGNYLRLTAAQRDLWHQMDGSRTVAQLATQAFLAHKQLLPVGDFVVTLKEEGFLVDRPVGVFRQVAAGLEARTAEGWGRRLLRALAGTTWQIHNIDAAYGAIYRAAGWLLFTPAFLAIWVVLVAAGLTSFALLLGSDLAASQVLSLNGSIALGLLTLWAMLLVSFVLHESAHALAVKHFRRTLHGGGVMLYYGMPAAFVDTTDIWRSPRRARIIVSAAGPMCDLLAGSLAALAAFAAVVWWPGSAAALAAGAIAFKLAFTCYVAALFNANPLLELDGYFILVDLLRLPDLRRRALAFVGGPLWQKLWRATNDGGARRSSLIAHHFSREEKIFTLYGALTVAYTAFAVVAALFFWRDQLHDPIMRLLDGGPWQRLLGVLLLLGVVIPVTAGIALAGWGVVRATIGWIVRRGYGRRPALLTGAALVVVLAAVAFSTRVEQPLVYWIAPTLWAIALGAQLALQGDYRGAAIAPALNALLLTTVCAGAAAAMRALDTPIWVAAEALAFVFLLLAGFAALLDVELRFVPPYELLSTALLLILTFAAGGLALVRAEESWPAASRFFHIVASAPAYFGALAVALMLPRLFDLRDSRLIWSWLLLWAGTLFETTTYVANLRQNIPPLDVLVAGLWAAAWLVHLATLRQITPDEIAWPHEASMSEAQRLERAIQFCYAGCYRLLRTVYGERRARAFDDRMDVIAATADWDVTLDRDRARIGEEVRRLPLDEQGSRFAEVLRYTVLMIEEITGQVFARRAIQAAYDALPWPERETASRLCFPDTPWARELSSAFGGARSGRLRLLRQVDLFLNCDDEELDALSHSIAEQRVAAHTSLLRAGHVAPGVWIVEAGEVVARAQGQVVAELHRGDSFGARELLEGRPSEYSYRASVESVLLFIPAQEYRRLSHEQAPHAAEALEAAEVLRLLERVPLFADMPRNTLRGLAHIAEQRRFEPRAVVVRQGQPSGVFYIIQEGQAAVLARETGEQGGSGAVRLVARIGPKEFFGELELLRGAAPVASVVTITPAVMLALPHAAIKALLLGDGGMAKSLEQIGTGRMLSLRQSAAT